MLVDKKLEQLAQAGHPFPIPVANSIVDTVFNLLEVGVNPKAAVVDQVVDQTMLVLQQAIGLSNDSANLLNNTIQGGENYINAFAVVAQNPNSVDGVKLNNVVLSSLASQDQIANELINGSIWPAQINTGKQILVIDAIIKAKGIQMTGGDATAAIVSAKQLAASLDSQNLTFESNPILAGAQDVNFQNFATQIAQKYNINGWLLAIQ